MDIANSRLKFREIAPPHMSDDELDELIVKFDFNDNDIANALCEMLGNVVIYVICSNIAHLDYL